MCRHRALPEPSGMRILLVTLLVVTGPAGMAAAQPGEHLAGFEIQSLDGRGNNRAHPDWGQAGTNYLRVAPAHYADGAGTPVGGPNTRYLSNRIFNDVEQNLFSERGISQWATTWGQFLDHTFGLRAGGGGEASIPFNNNDPLETFPSDLPFVPFERSAGTGTPREQLNTVSSYIEASTVYSDTEDRLEWLREGPVDGNLANNGARLLLPDRYLPRLSTRGDPASAPEMDDATGAMGDRAAVAGEFRGNENIALLATHTLLAREHNRIVGLLPGWLSEEQKFQIARRVVIATQQYITYNEFLPTLGIRLAPYRGYDPNVNASLGNEFATVGYRAHSMLRGDFTIDANANRYSQAQLDAWRAQGITVTRQGDRVRIVVPPSRALFNPDLVEGLQIGPLLTGLGRQKQGANDELIDNLVRSVQLSLCQPECMTATFDIAAIDVERGRDHGMPSYNDLRRAYGLAPKASFAAITGEATESFPADPELTPGAEIDDPDSLDFVRSGERRTPTAARLKAIYGDVSTMDVFVGMVAEPRVPGSELGELQLAIWKRQFEALRDGDRFFYRNDPVLTMIQQRFGIDYRHDLGDLIALNTDVPRSRLASNVFRATG
jgi:Animal haem peroxidase